MERLYPNPKTFVDNSEPDLDAEYFNGVEAGLSAVDERLANLLVSSLTTTVAGQKALDAIVGRILDERITANAEAIAKTNSNFSKIAVKGFSKANVVVKSGTRTVTTFTVPESLAGYRLIVPISVDTGNGYVQATITNFSNDSMVVLFHSLATTDETLSITIRALCFPQ